MNLAPTRSCPLWELVCCGEIGSELVFAICAIETSTAPCCLWETRVQVRHASSAFKSPKDQAGYQVNKNWTV